MLLNYSRDSFSSINTPHKNQIISLPSLTISQWDNQQWSSTWSVPKVRNLMKTRTLQWSRCAWRYWQPTTLLNPFGPFECGRLVFSLARSCRFSTSSFRIVLNLSLSLKSLLRFLFKLVNFVTLDSSSLLADQVMCLSLLISENLRNFLFGTMVQLWCSFLSLFFLGLFS